MNVVYKSFGFLKSMYNQLNPATLTGAIDIVVVEQPDGTLVASPFHVRFGKLGVLRAKEKVVKIAINDEKVRNLHMKLGDQGEAFFLEEIDASNNVVPARLITSPLPSRPSTPTKTEAPEVEVFEFNNISTEGKRRRRKKRKRRSLITNSFHEDAAASWESDDSNPAASSVIEDVEQRLTSLPKEFENDFDTDEIAKEISMIRCIQSDSDLPTVEYSEQLPSPFSDSEAIENRSNHHLKWGWGQLPGDGNVEGSSDESSSSHSTHEHDRVLPTVSTPGENRDEKMQVNKRASTRTITTSTSSNQSTSQQKEPSGLYLDDVLSLEPSEANLYLQGSVKENSHDQNENIVVHECVRGGGSDIDSGTDCQVREECICDMSSEELSDVKISLCGLKTNEIDEEKFETERISFESFVQNPSELANNPNLVVKIGNKYMNWQTAAPFIISLAVFKQPLPQEYLDRILEPSRPSPPSSSRLMGWLWRRPNKSDNATSEPSSPTKPTDPPTETVSESTSLDSLERSKSITIPARSRRQTESAAIAKNQTESTIIDMELQRSHSAQEIFPRKGNLLDPEQSFLKDNSMMRKTTRLTTEQLKILNLQEGENKITFSVTTQYQGTTRCVATIYKWKWSDKIVVSDIDGTITKSDVFGQILPVVGKDWTQGGVAKLYQNISRNGYQFIYVSSRAIGQATMTKGYLTWINQQGVCLPPGPLLLSPSSLMLAFKREVIEKKPEKFKIECLKDIKALFPQNPFAAGFGNKWNDVFAYTAVGIPTNRLFTINHKGELKHEELQTYTTSYNDLGEMVDNFFPALQNDQQFVQAHSYSDFTYWRDDYLDLDEFSSNY